MALVIGFPRNNGVDHSHRAVQRAKISVLRVKAREDEVRSVCDTMKRFFDEHTFSIRISKSSSERPNRTEL